MNIPDVIREKARDFTEKELEDYVTRVNKLLEGMKPGDRLQVSKLTRERNRDLFIECVKWFMRTHEWQDGLSFANGFNELHKYDLAFIKNENKKNVTL